MTEKASQGNTSDGDRVQRGLLRGGGIGKRDFSEVEGEKEMITTGTLSRPLTGIAVILTAVTVVLHLTGTLGLLVAAIAPTSADLTAEDAQTDARDDARTNESQQPKIAFVEDDEDFAETRIEVLQVVCGLSTIRFNHYPTCEDLLIVMRTGARYDLYLVDFYMEEAGGVLRGPSCTKRILELHPGAIVIGQSTDPVGGQFLNQGASGFVNKIAGGDAMAEIIRQLLGLP